MKKWRCRDGRLFICSVWFVHISMLVETILFRKRLIIHFFNGVAV